MRTPHADRGPRSWGRLSLVAVQFLTRVPVRVRFEPGDLQRSVGAFPAVGILVAGVGIVARWGLEPWFGAQLATVGAIAAMVAVTGALHEDGFADAADGLWGGATPQERLRIMRDSRLGTYGTLAIVLLIATKLLALSPLTLRELAVTLVPAMALARASSLVLMRALPPATDGLATIAGPPSVAAGTVACLTCGVSLAGFGRHAWLPLVVAGLATFASAAIARRKVGGINGDQLGAANQLVELSVLLCGVALFVPS